MKRTPLEKKILPKVLIAIPTYDAKNYCLDAFLDNISKFTYPKDRIEIYIADNSKDNKNALMINKKYGIKNGFMKKLENFIIKSGLCFIDQSLKNKRKYYIY